MKPDLDALRAASHADPDLREVLHTLLHLPRTSLIMRLRTLYHAVNPIGEGPLSWERVVGHLQLLSQHGCGPVHYPRNRHRAVIRWIEDPRALARQILARPSDPGATAGPFGAPSRAAIPEGWRQHPLLLRPGLTIELLLPADLTPYEAEKISHFVRALPLEGGISPGGG